MEGQPRRRSAEELAALVQQTHGLQPWRKLFHATNGSLIVAALTLVPINTRTVLAVLIAGFGVQLLVDVVRLTRTDLNVFLFRTFTPLASPREAKRFASSTWYTLGMILALSFFPLDCALAGILVMALADPAAALVGKGVGRIPLGQGSVEGTLAFFLIGLVILLFFAPTGPAAVTAALATAAERAPWPLDDNLVLPVVVAGCLFLTLG